MIGIVRVYVQYIKHVRGWREQAAAMAPNNSSRSRYQTAADAEASSMEYKLEQVKEHYAHWCPYMQLFCEAWYHVGSEVEARSIEDYLTCCRETQETIREALHAGFLNESRTKHLRDSLQFFEDTVAQMQLCQDQARRTKEEREKEEEKEIALREKLQQQNDEDFWDEYDRCIDQSLASWERKVRMEECARRMLKQQRVASRVVDRTISDGE